MPPEPEQFAEYVAALERLLAASIELCQHIGTGWEAHGQSMQATMSQQAVREFRKAVNVVQAKQYDGSRSNEEGGSVGT